jgi:DNA-binding beta-propeller fold protein YncE
MKKNSKEAISRVLGLRLVPAIFAVSMVTALVPSGVVQAKTPLNQVLKRVKTNFGLGANLGPAGIAVTPDNSAVYVAASDRSGGGPDSSVIVLNSQFDTITAVTRLYNDFPANTEQDNNAIGVAITPDNLLVFISNFGLTSTDGTVSVVSTLTNTQVGELHTAQIGPRPVNVAITKDGKELWVANSGQAPAFNNGTVTVVATSNGAGIRLINTGGSPNQIVFSTDGKTAYVLNAGPAGNTGFVDVIDVATHNITNPAFAAGIINNPAVSGEAFWPGSNLYVANNRASIIDFFAPSGFFVDQSSIFPTSVPPAKQRLGQPSITPGLGKFLYIADPTNAAVSWLTTVNDFAQQSAPIHLAVGSHPYWTAISPDGTRLYVSDFDRGANAGLSSFEVIDITLH